MSDSTDLSYLSEEQKENNPQKRNLWYVDVDLSKKYNLSFIETGFLCMIIQLQCVKDGFCRAKNYYFEDALGITRKWIERSLKKLQDLNLIWVYHYNTKHGVRRHIVTADSIRTYQAFLIREKQWSILKKFQQEFACLNIDFNNPEEPKTPPKNEPQVLDTIPCDMELDRPCDKMSHDPCDKMSHADNTTYYPNKENYVTCKSPDGQVAVAFEELKKELENSLSKEQVEIGLKWYQLQTEAQKANMQKPIACIMNAIKQGYAEQAVSEKNAQQAAEAAKKEKEKQVKIKQSDELSANQKLARQLIQKFSNTPGWRYKIDKSCFVVFNDLIQKERDEQTGAMMCRMPNGTLRFGPPGVRVDFSMNPQVFKKTLKEFVLQCNWIPEDRGQGISA